MKRSLLTIMTALLCTVMTFAQNINFADPKVKEICVANWDTNGDRELSTEEAAEVQSLEGLFNNQPEITSFDEFQYFTGISEIDVHEGEGENSFWGCTNLKSIIIPNSVNFIGSTLREFLEFMIPETIIPGEGPFKGCTSLNSIYIPNSVTTIGDAAFRGCSALKSINIPNTVTSIGRAAFANCSLLESINIPNSVTEMGQGAFYKCSNLKSINLPNGVKQLGEALDWSYRNYYDGYSNKDNIGDFPRQEKGISGIKKVGPWYYFDEFVGLFEGCTSLTNIDIPYPYIMATIGDRCFKDCANLQNITHLNRVKEIGLFAFAGCTSLNNVNLGYYLKVLKPGTFQGCTGLTSITLPNSLEKMESYYWDIDDADPCLDGIVGPFEGCAMLDNVIIPNSMKSIGMCAFEGCI